MPIAFDNNVAAAWQVRLKAAYVLLPSLINTCIQRMTPGTIDWPLYRTWFDPAGNANMANVQFVRRVFSTLGQWVAGKTLRFFDATGNATDDPAFCAYVWMLSATPESSVSHVGSGVRIGISGGMVRATWTTKDVAALITHELVHKLGGECGQPIFDNAPGYGRVACLAKALAPNPILALTNADNYRLYLKQANGIPWIGDL